jgi:hypothetical protein
MVTLRAARETGKNAALSSCGAGAGVRISAACVVP